MSDVDMDRIQKTLTDVQISVAAGFAAVNARLDASKDHEPRIRQLEQRLQHILTREDVADLVADAIEKSRRPRWADVGALVVAIAAASGIVIGAIQVIVHV